MAYAPKSTRPQAAESLAEKLDRLDAYLGKLDGRFSTNALDILKLMDEIQVQLQIRDREGVTSIAEKAQFDAACAVLKKSSQAFLHAAGGRKPLIAQRAAVNPSADSWWWRLDEIVARQNKQRLVKFLRLATGILLVAVVGIIIYNRFLAPSPETVARYGAQQRVMEYAQQGNYEQALNEVEKVLQTLPQDRDLLMLKAGVLQAQGKNQASEAIFSEIQSRYPDLPEFYLTKSQSFIMLARPELAGAEARKALAIDPELAEAYLLLGGAQEMQENFDDALTNYNMAAQIASKQGDINTEISAKMRAATLMQRAPAGLFPGTR